MFWLRLALALAAGLALVWIFGPRDRLRPDPVTVGLPADPQAWLAAREAGIRPEVASYLQWAGQPGQATDLAILYVHGFSASPAELRPLPEDLARQLGANLLAIRLTGHGQGGADLASARAQDWWRDLAEGLAAARQLGRRVVVLGMSTGATLTALAARDPQTGRAMDGVVLISPNFTLRGRGAWRLDLPFARTILRLTGDPERCFVTRNALHRARWTSCYPARAVLPVGALVRQARRGDYRAARVPALFVWSDADRIIDHRASARVAAGWGGGATVLKVTPGPNDDPDGHVIAGEALSPGLTRDLVPAIAGWIRDLGPGS
ncbi:alpha/beta hydrolase [Paracoccus sp. YIM 132242]|uniref:Alpha/beta hydrolase n=1 Tax=Paracoccus lichenicola TaxID=2665644 RepID=A0A6L6HK46_9RHOB|nr:alpha/beta hydrolase [Paracoccus lichenicola]MTD99533.1 alpha/beta hydrolase [Paracoccus lichenicola]